MPDLPRQLASLAFLLAIMGWVLPAAADPLAEVVISLPPADQGDIFSPGVVPVDSLKATSRHGKKGKKGKYESQAYIEEEYFVEGTADVFQYGDPPELHELLLRDDVETEYKTRFIIRRPEDMGYFRGTLVVEWWNSTAGFDTAPAWDASAEHFASRGWIYVGISNSSQVFGFLRNGCSLFPPITPILCDTRYESLSLPENGIAYEMVSQIVNLLLGDDPQNPLLDYRIKRVLHVGQSQQAGSVNTYAREFHLPHLSDGYFIQAGGGTARSLSSGSPEFGFGDPRGLPPTDLEVPVIRVQTETEVETFFVTANRQDDTATFRYYEIAGATHLTVHKDVEIVPPGIFGPNALFLEDLCLNPMNSLVDGPVFGKYVYNAMWHSLDRQARHPQWHMPVGELIEIEPDLPFAIARDSDGNALGGIRLPDMNVPTASYYQSTNEGKAACGFPPFPPECNPIGALGDLACRLAGSYAPFDAETLESRYPSSKDYEKKVRHDARRLRKQRFLTRDGEREIVERAKAANIPN